MNQKTKPAECLAHTTAANQKVHTYYRYKTPIAQGRFNRFLPNPTHVLSMLGFSVEKTNAKGYFNLRCPFHKDGNERTASLNLHKSTGHYRCHACGAKGGDILAFYMNVTGKSFVTSAKELGVWEIKYGK